MLYFFALLSLAWSEPQMSCQNIFSAEALVHHHQTPLTFTKTEVFRRNNDIGMQQMGRLRFVEWAELTFEFKTPERLEEAKANIIGLTEEGRLYHLIKFENRTLARLLSGENHFASFELSNKGRLVAWTPSGSGYVYRPELWVESPKKKVLKHWAKLWALTTAPILAGKNFFFESMHITLDLFNSQVPLPLMDIYIGGLVALSSGFAMLSKYDHHNTHPDGFVASPVALKPESWPQDHQWNESDQWEDLKHFAAPELESLPPVLEQTEEIR